MKHIMILLVCIFLIIFTVGMPTIARSNAPNPPNFPAFSDLLLDEQFSDDVFANGSWARSNTSVSVDTANGWLHFDADLGNDDYAEKAASITLPITIETRLRLISGGGDYRTAVLHIVPNDPSKTIVLVYGSDPSMGWVFNIWGTWTGIHTQAPPSENVWITVKAVIRADGGELWAKFDSDQDFIYVTSSTWSIPTQITAIRFYQPWDSINDVDYIQIDGDTSQACIGSPVDVMIVIDRSGSMSGSPLIDEKNAAKGFIDRMNLSQDQVGLASFETSATLDHFLSHEGASVKNAVDALLGGDTTNMSAAIDIAQAELISARHNPLAPAVMLLMSDGVPFDVDTPAQALAAANAAKNQGTRILTIGLGNQIDENLLQQIATYPSDYYYAPTSADLERIYQAIADYVTCTQLRFTYLPLTLNSQQNLDEARVRYIIADSQLGGVIDYYRQHLDDPTVAEAVRRWDACVRVLNVEQFERKIVGRYWQVVYAGTDTMIDGMDVEQTPEGCNTTHYCNNSYWPIVEGAYWVYSGFGDDSYNQVTYNYTETWTIMPIIGDTQNASFSVLRSVYGDYTLSIQEDFVCNQDGIHKIYTDPLLYLPPEYQLVIGNEWLIDEPAALRALIVVTDDPIVSVPAGVYETFLIDTYFAADGYRVNFTKDLGPIQAYDYVDVGNGGLIHEIKLHHYSIP